MTTFVQHAACKGHRPPVVEAHRHQSRPALVARLLRDRKVARFLVAPDGFGKSALAYEYAEVMFSFEHVFWMQATSPCFLRDLDAGTLLSDMRQADDRCALVVFEDVPLLSEDRAQAFSQVIDNLLEEECEVLATITPARDGLEGLQRDRLTLNGTDLLLDDQEAARNRKGEPSGDYAPFPLAARIAGVRWAEDGMRALLEGAAREDLPDDLLLVMWLLLALGSGSVGEAAGLLGPRRTREAWEFLGARYPFLGIEGESPEGIFCAMRATPEELAQAFGRRMGELARTAGCASRDELASYVADLLIRRGEAPRAGRMMGAFASRSMVARWLRRAGWSLLWGRAPLELCLLYEPVAHGKVAGRPAVNAMMACASGQLKDGRRALDYAKKALGSSEAGAVSRVAALLVARHQGNASVVVRTEALLCEWLEELDDAVEEVPAALRALVEVTLAPEGPQGKLAAWEDVQEPDARQALVGSEEGELWLLVAAQVMGAFADARETAPEAATSLEESCALDALAELCCESIDYRVDRDMPLGLGSLRAAEQLHRLDGELSRRKSRTLSPAACLALRNAQIESACSLEDYRDLRSRRGPVASLGSVAPLRDRTQTNARGAWREGASATLPAPLLHVRLFGALSVRVGGRELPSHLFARRKVRLMLALLVVNRGRDLTRDALAGMLWPELPSKSRTKNFYRMWTLLENALSGSDPCPYLVRDRYGCRLDPALFTSDVMEFEELTRHLLFGDVPPTVTWEMLYQMVKGPFSGELLPIEQDNDALCRLRDRFNIELVDSLVAAAGRLCQEGEPQGALWFAREALVRDPTREDAYAALMEAQMASGQRTAALDTFFTCRTYLADTLGLDPSAQLLMLYQRLLEEGTEMSKREG